MSAKKETKKSISKKPSKSKTSAAKKTTPKKRKATPTINSKTPAAKKDASKTTKKNSKSSTKVSSKVTAKKTKSTEASATKSPFLWSDFFLTTKKTAHSAEKDVDLPSNMSLRAIEKSRAITTLLSDDIAHRVRIVAYIPAACFILFGSLYAFGNTDQGATYLASLQSSNVANTLLSNQSRDTTTNLRTDNLPVSEDRISLRINSTVVEEPTTINITAPENTNYIELYAKQPGGRAEMLLGIASNRAGKWSFFLDPSQMRSGPYIITAFAKREGGRLESDPLNVTIIKPAPEVSVSERVPTSSSPIIRVVEEVRPYPLQPTAAPEQEARELLGTNEAEVRELLTNYSRAQETNNSNEIERTRRELRQKQDEIRRTAVWNESSTDAEEISTEIDDTFENLVERAEVLARLKQADRSAKIDTDGDGISDIDESQLYFTDPELADTDEDGVADGAEIRLGTDPTNSDVGARIRYESPRETITLVREDVLTVATVTPKVESEEGATKARVQAVVQGTALPGSFATIYMFSTPKVITVATNDDGSFSYTFEEELEDGSHEVYVAITDASGAIVAQSNPFAFVKQAEAFTAAANGNTSSLQTAASGNPYALAAGLGLLGLGLILLLLGSSLRQPQPTST